MVDLSGNHLTQLPGEVKYLVGVSDLLLDGNLLEVLPEEMAQLLSLRVLSIKNNSILLLWDGIQVAYVHIEPQFVFCS